LSGTAANAVVPELGVVDLGRSLAFYRDILGFVVAYERPEEGFASIRHEECTLMLDQIGVGRTFQTGLLEPPLGRGLNLQLTSAPLRRSWRASRLLGRRSIFHWKPEVIASGTCRSRSTSSAFRIRTAICCASAKRLDRGAASAPAALVRGF
jgi:hypothetical protein